MIATLIVLAVGVAIVAEWGPWPSAKTLLAASTLAFLRMMQLFAQKADLLSDLLTVQLGLLVLLFGSRFKAGWRSHPQQIVIGLSTASISQLAVRVIWQQIALHSTIHSQAEYQQGHGAAGQDLSRQQRGVSGCSCVVDRLAMVR